MPRAVDGLILAFWNAPTGSGCPTANDALERLRIQHDAALFLPSVVTGSHVGPRKSHTSGRVLDISFRAWVAAQRHMGFEMDPRELTDREADVLREATSWWKANRDWMAGADILRLDSADPAGHCRNADGPRRQPLRGLRRAGFGVRPSAAAPLAPDPGWVPTPLTAWR